MLTEGLLLATTKLIIATEHPGREQRSFQKTQGQSMYISAGVFEEHRKEDLKLKFAMLTRYLFTSPIDNLNPWRQSGNSLAFTARGFIRKTNALNFNVEADYINISSTSPHRDLALVQSVINGS